MARGSDPTPGGPSAGSSSGTEMLGATGTLLNNGKASLTKKFFVTTEADLQNAPEVPDHRPTAITHVKVGPGWEQTVNYEALHNGAVLGSEGSGPDAAAGTFEVLTSYEIMPIIKHPRIGFLKRKYSGTDTIPGVTVVFPEFLSSGGGLGGTTRRNPMYGVTSYKEYTFTFRHTYYRPTISGDLLRKAGTVVTKLPAGFPPVRPENDSDGKGIPRQWMVQMPGLRKEGGVWRIEQDYLLLDARGMAEDVYVKGT